MSIHSVVSSLFMMFPKTELHLHKYQDMGKEALFRKGQFKNL